MQLPFYSNLADVRAAAAGCQGCGRSKQRSQVVMGSGAPDASLMLIAEYPSRRDDQTGEPFTGPAGVYLDELLNAAGASREQIYITNIVRCFATQGGNQIRSSTKQERVACNVWTELELQFVNPSVILAIGAPPASALIGEDFKLTEQHGEWYRDAWGRWITATLQPAYVLRMRAHDPERADKLHQVILDDLRAAVAQSLRS